MSKVIYLSLNDYIRYLLFIIVLSFLTACGSGPKQLSRAEQERISRQAKEAEGSSRQSRRSRRRASSNCVDLSCFPESEYVVGEGSGASKKNAKNAAISDLIETLSSTVESSSSSRLEEGTDESGDYSRFTGSIDIKVVSRFEHRNLIKLHVKKTDDEQSPYSAVATLKIKSYLSRLKRALFKELNLLKKNINKMKTAPLKDFVSYWHATSHILVQYMKFRETHLVLKSQEPKLSVSWADYQKVISKRNQFLSDTNIKLSVSSPSDSIKSEVSKLLERLSDSHNIKYINRCKEGAYELKAVVKQSKVQGPVGTPGKSIRLELKLSTCSGRSIANLTSAKLARYSTQRSIDSLIVKAFEDMFTLAQDKKSKFETKLNQDFINIIGKIAPI